MLGALLLVSLNVRSLVGLYGGDGCFQPIPVHAGRQFTGRYKATVAQFQLWTNLSVGRAGGAVVLLVPRDASAGAAAQGGNVGLHASLDRHKYYKFIAKMTQSQIL